MLERRPESSSHFVHSQGTALHLIGLHSAPYAAAKAAPHLITDKAFE